MARTTATTKNIELAKRFLKVRAELKALKKEETELKVHFNHVMGDDNNLIVNTALVITRTSATRETYDKSKLDEFFYMHDIPTSEFKTRTTFFRLSIGEAS